MDGISRRDLLGHGVKAGGALALGSSLAAALAACGSSSPAATPKSFRFANWGGSEPTTTKMFASWYTDFERKTGIHVEPVTIPFLQYSQELTTLIASGQAPDLAQSFELFTSAFVGMGAARELGGLVSAKTLAGLENVGASEFNGKLFAVPWSMQPLVLFWQKKFATMAGIDPATGPTSWSEFEQLIGYDKYPSGVSGLAITSSKEPSVYFWWYPLLWGFGGDVIDADGNVALDQPPAIQFGEWAQEAYAKRWLSNGINGTEARVVFTQAKAAAILDAPLGRSVFTPTGQSFDALMGAGLLPHGPVESELRNSDSGHQLVLFRQSQAAPHALQFVDYLLGGGPQLQNYNVESEAPVSKSLMGANAEFQTPFFDVVRKGAQVVKNPPQASQFNTITDTFMGALQAIWNGTAVRPAFTQAADQIRSLLKP